MRFWKMHGLGNDYVVVDNRKEEIREHELQRIAQTLCERRFSIGADGMLLICDSEIADVKMRIFNADGSEAEMCGNGIRCFAKYCYENDITKKNEISIETLAGTKKVWLNIVDANVQNVRVDMGPPVYEKQFIPMLGDGTCINEDLEVGDRTFRVTCLSVGNPHCVTFVDNVKDFPVEAMGPQIENHKIFPKRINVEFVQVLDRRELIVRVWERGVGETLACGTGACASAAAAHLLGKTDARIVVHLPGGDLEIEIPKSILMTGPAQKIFHGMLFEERERNENRLL
jgi:diaminopimelate epimerase